MKRWFEGGIVVGCIIAASAVSVMNDPATLRIVSGVDLVFILACMAGLAVTK